MPPAHEVPETISWKAVFLVLLLFIAILIAGATFYQAQEQQIREQVTSDLTSIAKLKALQIASWREDRLYDARVVSSSNFFVEGADQYLADGDPESRENILTRFREMNTSSQYQNILLVDPKGNVRISLDSSVTTIPPQVRSQVTSSLARGDAVMTEFHLMPGTGHIHQDVIAPLVLKREGSEKPVGAVILSINPDNFLYPFIQSWPVPSSSAETLLVMQEEDYVLFLNNLRHRDNTALNLTIPLTETDVPAVMAVLGTTGAFNGRDYRGVDVISVLEPIPGSPWFMVTKVDTSEAFAGWRERSGLIILLIAGVLAGSVVVAGLLWQRRQKYYYHSLYVVETQQREDERKSRERIEILLQLTRMESASKKELADYILEAACRLTGSPLAFVGMMSPDESAFDITAWSISVMKDCSVSQSPIHFPVDKAGIWADAIRKRVPVLVNDYIAPHPGKKGLPAGHVPIHCFVSVPIFDRDKIVMVSAVANKDTVYSQADVDNLVLLMQGVWAHLRKRQADEALQQKTADLEAAYEEITASEEELRTNYKDLALSQQAQKESEDAIRTAKAFLDRVIDMSPFALWISDGNGTVTRVNRSLCETIRLKPEDIIGKYNVLNDTNLKNQGVMPDVHAVFSEKKPARFTIPWKAADAGDVDFSGARDMYIDVSMYPILDARGDLASVVCQWVDITEQKRAQETILNSRNFLDSIIEQSPNPIWISDENGTLIRLNRACRDLLNITDDEVVGKYNIFHDNVVDAQGKIALVRSVFEKGRPVNFDIEYDTSHLTAIPLRHSAKVYLNVTIFPIFNANKKVTNAVIQHLDFTQRRVAENQREQLIRELERKNTELEHFTYTISHDLRSPLITIKGFAGFLEEDARKCDPLQLQKDVLRITHAADTMQQLLTDILELSRVGRVVAPLKKEPFGTIVQEALEILAAPLEERTISIVIASDLPEVNVDRTRIREVMVNLIENAIKYSGDRPDPVIRIGVDYGGEVPVFFVQDNGIGIDPRYLERIFNLFEKLDPSYPGTGVGLTIVKRIIEAHGGKIWAESEGPGKGTTIRFTLPVL